MIDYKKINEEKIAETEQKVYGGTMPAANKQLMRKQLEAEDRFWQRWDVRKDSNRGADDQ